MAVLVPPAWNYPEDPLWRDSAHLHGQRVLFMESYSHQWVPWLPQNQPLFLWLDADVPWRVALFFTMILDLPVDLLDPVLSNLAALKTARKN